MEVAKEKVDLGGLGCRMVGHVFLSFLGKNCSLSTGLKQRNWKTDMWQRLPSPADSISVSGNKPSYMEG